jgi:hypothetical protein
MDEFDDELEGGGPFRKSGLDTFEESFTLLRKWRDVDYVIDYQIGVDKTVGPVRNIV